MTFLRFGQYPGPLVVELYAPSASPNSSGAWGWMHDFGEYLPFDAQLASGEDPVTFHNRFTERWSELGRAAIEEARLEEERLAMLL